MKEQINGSHSNNEDKSINLGHCLVTGASGDLGRNLVKELIRRGFTVRALIHSKPIEFTHPNLSCFTGDLRSKEDMKTACEGIDTVFHAGSLICLLGGIGVTRKYRQQAYEINVDGTGNIIAGCQANGVKRLVYTSSVDVCFEGKPLPHMKETLPYAGTYLSVYTETKIKAESMVLNANGVDGVLTCAVRPDGIYGAGPNQMIERFAKAVSKGKIKVIIGDGKTLQDNSSVDNLVHGEILAAENLAPGSAACGKAYFICDNEPRNSFDFFRPLIEGLGYTFPNRKIPVGLLMPVMRVWQFLHFRLGISPPLMTPHELFKVSVTHYAGIESARKDLGYEPVKKAAETIAECVEYCMEKGYQ